MKLVTRAQWGARAPKSRRTGNLKETSTVHWNGPKMPDVPHDRCASVVRGTQNFHMDGRGWSDVAYNFLICRHGYVFEGRGLNVWNGANGTNTGNQTSHAVMALAGTGNPITAEMKQAIKDAVAYIDQYTSAPGSPVRGHRDHKSTECPGNELYAWVHAGLPVASKPAPALPEELYMFKPGQNIENVIKDSYTHIAGRPVESKEVLDTWHWALAVGQGEAYSQLINGLHKEARMRRDNELKALEQRITGISTGGAVLTEEQILGTVYKDLVEKISD